MANTEEMQELHMAASAYYRNASNGLRQRASDFFYSMDINGDGGVSFNELYQFFFQNGYNRVSFNFFQSLDRDGNQILDFSEVLTFYYILKTRVVFCACCQNYQFGRYFTCVYCFNNARNTGTYDLCPTCYDYGEWRHPHSRNNFLDNYGLLRDRAGFHPASASNMWCSCCRTKKLTGLYFSCVDCFNTARNRGTYDLCSMCYKERRHQHQQRHPHRIRFWDNYVLLRYTAGFRPFAGAPNFQRALVPGRAPSTAQQRMMTTFQALETGVNVVNAGVNVANADCSIM
ncbi:uncharacterized protein LOC115959504 [Quercus lobata]|uniref:uncharacterized protein LOC115959504 n=1 Tax=Quercus lobata TaxID=97700 RepID=UPI0012452281|nr:uncharacterized protein LOC115959504 [Quercus lobata]XP_030933783.1 uncharacterized protein LOC115959504 [Quercus lobata]